MHGLHYRLIFRVIESSGLRCTKGNKFDGSRKVEVQSIKLRTGLRKQPLKEMKELAGSNTELKKELMAAKKTIAKSGADVQGNGQDRKCRTA